MAYFFPVLFALLVWWFSTGAILALGRRMQNKPRRALAVASLPVLLALFWLYITKDTEQTAFVFTSFTAAIIIWGWNELAFLTGVVTGPRTTPCPCGATGMRKFVAAFETIAYHEFALLFSGMAIALFTLGGQSKTALATFGILWLMRISAKLNLYCGAPNASTDLLPKQLHYLKSYFETTNIGICFAFTVTLATIVFAYFVMLAGSAQTMPELVQATLFASLVGLAIIEHWFFVLQFNEGRLWALFN